MPSPDPIIAQRVADLLGRLTIMDSLLPQITDRTLRNTFALEIIQLRQGLQQLQD
jgi:hypothetical protein